MAGIAVTLVNNNFAGGSGSATVSTNEYANAAAAVAAIATGFLPITAPLDGGKPRSINVSRIEAIVSL